MFTPHGLREGDLVQGTLRIVSTNPSEAYVECPFNKKSNELMIIGVRDRSHAQEGDTVVAQVKPRINWIVREEEYNKWIDGTLDLPCDEDGHPLTIPPMKNQLPVDEEAKRVLDFLPQGMQKRIKLNKLREPVPVSKNNHYSREEFLRMGIQIKMQALKEEEKQQNDEAALISPAHFDEEVLSQLTKLKIEGAPADASGDSKGDHSPIVSNSGNSNRKPKVRKFRFLTDLDQDEWMIVPYVCLQKTAKVSFVAEPNYNNKPQKSRHA